MVSLILWLDKHGNLNLHLEASKSEEKRSIPNHVFYASHLSFYLSCSFLPIFAFQENDLIFDKALVFVIYLPICLHHSKICQTHHFHLLALSLKNIHERHLAQHHTCYCIHLQLTLFSLIMHLSLLFYSKV